MFFGITRRGRKLLRKDTHFFLYLQEILPFSEKYLHLSEKITNFAPVNDKILAEMKRIETIIFALLLTMGLWAKGQRQTVVFDVNIHCEGCITKIEKNIAFERGVKDMECSLEDKTVTIVFDPEKTDIPHLQAAFAKIGKVAKVHIDDSEAEETEQKESVDAQSGASTPN